MAYAGICGSDDLQLHSDDYFHAISFDEIAAYTTTPGSPGNLGAAPSGNTPPTVTVNGGPFTIPIRTPFALSATGTDANGDALTYTWEQYDGGALRSAQQLRASRPVRCSARSRPSPRPPASFPKMSSVLANTTNATSGTCPALPGGLELLGRVPAHGRTHHELPRDASATTTPQPGGVNSADVVVTAAGTAPFLVTSPNTAVSLPGGSAQTVTWNVAADERRPDQHDERQHPAVDRRRRHVPDDAARQHAERRLAVGDPAEREHDAGADRGRGGRQHLLRRLGRELHDHGGGGNMPPVANADTAATRVNTAVPIAVLANDTDSRRHGRPHDGRRGGSPGARRHVA